MSKGKSIIKEVNVKFLEVPGMYMEQWQKKNLAWVWVEPWLM